MWFIVLNEIRGVAQSGRVLALGARCRRFESCLPDHKNNPVWDFFISVMNANLRFDEVKRRKRPPTTEDWKVIYWNRRINMLEKMDIFDEYMDPVEPFIANIDEVHTQGLWHKTFACWVVNEKTKKVYLQLRGPKNRNDPNTLDISSSGHLRSGEDPMKSSRELKEELGINPIEQNLKFIGIKRNFSTNGRNVNREFCYTFLYKTDLDIKDLTLEKGEVDGIFELDLNQGIDFFSGKIPEISINGLEFIDNSLQKSTRKITLKDIAFKKDRCENSKYYLKIMLLLKQFLNNEKHIIL